MNQNNELVWNKVLDWSCVKNQTKKWIKLDLDYTTGKRKLKCTEDHEVFYFDDVLNPEIRFDQAKNLAGKYLVRNDGNSLYNKTKSVF